MIAGAFSEWLKLVLKTVTKQQLRHFMRWRGIDSDDIMILMILPVEMLSCRIIQANATTSIQLRGKLDSILF